MSQTIDYRKPFFIVTLGPTGSGKSTLLEKTIKYKNLGLNPKKFISVSIDDLVERSPIYKKAVKNIIKQNECWDSNTNNITTSDSCNLKNPSPELFEAFEKTYWDARMIQCNKSESKGCDAINDDKLGEAIRNNDNIIVETTGRTLPLWHVEQILDNAENIDYNIIFIYSLVNFDELMKRNKSRAAKQVKEFMTSPYENPAPRLPDVSEKVFKELTTNIVNNLLTLRNICMATKTPPPDDCGKINNSNMFTLLIFDNNTRRSNVIYDSTIVKHKNINDETFKKMIFRFHLSDILTSTTDSMGRKNISKRRKKFLSKKTKREKKIKYSRV